MSQGRDRTRVREPRTKGGRRIFYDHINRHLESSKDGDSVVHLNYGYAADGTARRAPFAARDPDFSTDLVLEVIGGCALAARAMLDVGCGRGGTVRTIMEYFPDVASIVGCDFSDEAVAFCRRTNRHRNAHFVVGDAERLPIASASVDVVINIESACCYPDVFAFYREVRRVLRPGGRFLYADSIETQEIEARVSFLSSLAFDTLDRRDVTRNVLRACGARWENSAAAGADAASDVVRPDSTAPVMSDSFLSNLVAMPGSHKFEKYAAGREGYFILDLIKAGEPDQN